MWELTIRGVDFYHLANWFFIYSFFGWLWETGYVSLKNGKYVNRGFVNGPLCTIYGFGALSVYLILKPWSGNTVILFFGGIVVATALEYVTAVLMETIFHTSWWDYSDQKFNFQGRICLGVSLGWGVFTLLLFRVLHPMVEKIVSLYPVTVGKVAVCVIALVYLVDFCCSAAAAARLHEKIPAMEQAAEQIREEFLLRMHEHFKNTGVSREATLERVRERLEDVSVLKDMEEKRAALIAELTAEYERRKKEAASRQGHNIRRFVSSYPNLNRGYKLRKFKKEKHQEEKKDH